MNKFEALIITGKLEVYFAGEKELLDEVKSIQKCIVDDDLINLAISLGRLDELSNSTNENVGKYLDNLMRFCIASNIENGENVKQEAYKNMTVEELDLSVRTYNVLTRNRPIRTVEDILAMDRFDFSTIRNLGRKSALEVVEKMETLGFVEWAKGIRKEMNL